MLNGAGEVSGLTQVAEWGLLETPILLTNTMAVGKVSDAAVKWMTKKWPKIGSEDDVVIPLVGECDDSWLNDAVGRHVRSEHVYRAIEQATRRPGRRGLGRRRAPASSPATSRPASAPARAGSTIEGNDYTVGILVQSNFGVMRSLRVDGAPVGEVLEPDVRRRRAASATPARSSPSSPPTRRCSRRSWCACASARRWGSAACGSFAAHGSGEIMVAFSTANIVPRADLAR